MVNVIENVTNVSIIAINAVSGWVTWLTFKSGDKVSVSSNAVGGELISSIPTWMIFLILSAVVLFFSYGYLKKNGWFKWLK